MNANKIKAIRADLSEQESTWLNTIKQYFGLRFDAEAVRLALRRQCALIEGATPEELEQINSV